MFIVRDDRPADVLVQCPDNTWQATTAGPTPIRCTSIRATSLAWCNTTVDVSFDRPYGKYVQI